MDERPSRVEVTIASPIAIAVLVISLAAAAITAAIHPAVVALGVFAIAFPVLWVGLATILSYATAASLLTTDVRLPERMHAMESFRLVHTLANASYVLPAVGVMANVRCSVAGAVLPQGPWAEVPVIPAGRAVTTSWDITVKRRGFLRVGPFRASVELPGSALRATAIFDTAYTVSVLPAVYHLQPFVDSLLAGRHVAVGRFQMLPAAVEEYVGSREYRPGDAPKLVHRVLSLRAPDPTQYFIREFRDPSSDDLSIVLDTAPPLDGNETVHRYRLEKAISFVAALCRTLAARRLTVRFVCQRTPSQILTLRVRPLDADLDRLERELSVIELGGDRRTITRVLFGEVRRHGAAVVFVSLRPHERLDRQRLSVVTLTPDHVPVFTREVVEA